MNVKVQAELDHVQEGLLLQVLRISLHSPKVLNAYDHESSFKGSCLYHLSFSGHSNGAIQMWDLTTALDFFNKNEKTDYQSQAIQTGNKLGIHSDQGGPTTQELVITSELEYNFVF